MTSDTKNTGEKHTPGPWAATRTGDGKRITIGDGLVEGPNGYEVAEVYSDDCPREVAEANARLIAAAPELLEAARDARNALLSTEANRTNGDAIAKVEAAIARATGAA